MQISLAFLIRQPNTVFLMKKKILLHYSIDKVAINNVWKKKELSYFWQRKLPLYGIVRNSICSQAHMPHAPGIWLPEKKVQKKMYKYCKRYISPVPCGLG